MLASTRPLEEGFDYPALSCSTIVSKEAKALDIMFTSSILNDLRDVGSQIAIWTLYKRLDASNDL